MCKILFDQHFRYEKYFKPTRFLTVTVHYEDGIKNTAKNCSVLSVIICTTTTTTTTV